MVLSGNWLSDAFWSESIWLSPGVKWADVTNGPDKTVRYPDVKDFQYIIPLMIMWLLVRYLFERRLFTMLGRALGIKDKMNRKVPDVPLLESAYRKSPQLKYVTALAKRVDMSERQVERWWRLRSQANTPSDIRKFGENIWKGCFHGGNSIVGMYILWDKDYYWDLDKCYEGYPHQGITDEIWWFYILYTAYMWSTVIMVFYDIRRKDFKQMLIHHITTSLLLSISWMSSLYRIGLAIIPMQDGSESLVEIAKACKLAKYKYSAKYVFYIFTLIWLYERMYIYPVYILHSTLVRLYAIVTPCLMANVLNVMLMLLMVLQVHWTYLILQVCYKSVIHGVEHDVRSSSSESSDTQQLLVSGKKKGIHTNGDKIMASKRNNNTLYKRDFL